MNRGLLITGAVLLAVAVVFPMIFIAGGGLGGFFMGIIFATILSPILGVVGIILLIVGAVTTPGGGGQQQQQQVVVYTGGQPLVQTGRFCSQCGAQITGGHRFCAQCGAAA